MIFINSIDSDVSHNDEVALPLAWFVLMIHWWKCLLASHTTLSPLAITVQDCFVSSDSRHRSLAQLAKLSSADTVDEQKKKQQNWENVRAQYNHAADWPGSEEWLKAGSLNYWWGACAPQGSVAGFTKVKRLWAMSLPGTAAHFQAIKLLPHQPPTIH